MSQFQGFDLRDGAFDVIIAQAPHVEPWPTVGARAIATLCSEMGLSVGVFGGETIKVLGVIPEAGTGGSVLAQDAQARIHRLRARAIVRVSSAGVLPKPFPGWRSPGLIPIRTAQKLLASSRVRWSPATVILGTGNKALRMGSELIEDGACGPGEVYCVETASAAWGAKRFAGWEVERRRFEVLGGRILEAEPVSLTEKGPMQYEFRVKDANGVRVIECARVIGAGPYHDGRPVREYPPASLLFEFEQSAGLEPEEDIEGWILEDERGRYLAGRLIRALVPDLGPRKEDLDAVLKQSRSRLKRYLKHREHPFTPAYEGKWIARGDRTQMRAMSGLPQVAQMSRELASIECFEEIACDLCARACPTQAIKIGRIPRDGLQILQEDKCTACGICLAACPSRAIVMVHEPPNRSNAIVVLPWKQGESAHRWSVGEFASLLNRRGEQLGNGRVVEITDLSAPWDQTQIHLIKLEVPSHLAWEARGIRPPRQQAVNDPVYLASLQERGDPKVEISFNGEKRLVREAIPVTLALFELGHARPEDTQLCADGSCQLCQVWVDGVKKLACQVRVHQGMAIKVSPEVAPDIARAAPTGSPGDSPLCACLGVTESDVVERLRKGGLMTPDAVTQTTRVGSGRCHGQLCTEALRQILINQGMDASRWVDWRFPWVDWVLQARSRFPSKTARSLDSPNREGPSAGNDSRA